MHKPKWYIQKMEHYSAIKRNKVYFHAKYAYMHAEIMDNFENITLNGREDYALCDLIYITECLHL
jgi:hypothetical protein